MSKKRKRRERDEKKQVDTPKTPAPITPFPAASPPGKLTEEIANAICEAVSKGFHKTHIAGSVGIDRVTLYRWLERGDVAEPGDEIYATFATQFKKAQADFIQKRFATIIEASDKTWTAAAWMLERLYPDEYSDPGKELARLRNEVAELKKLVTPDGDDNAEAVGRLEDKLEGIHQTLQSLGPSADEPIGRSSGSDEGSLPVRPEQRPAD